MKLLHCRETGVISPAHIFTEPLIYIGREVKISAVFDNFAWIAAGLPSLKI